MEGVSLADIGGLLAYAESPLTNLRGPRGDIGCPLIKAGDPLIAKGGPPMALGGPLAEIEIPWPMQKVL